MTKWLLKLRQSGKILCHVTRNKVSLLIVISIKLKLFRDIVLWKYKNWKEAMVSQCVFWKRQRLFIIFKFVMKSVPMRADVINLSTFQASKKLCPKLQNLQRNFGDPESNPRLCHTGCQIKFSSAEMREININWEFFSQSMKWSVDCCVDDKGSSLGSYKSQ